MSPFDILKAINETKEEIITRENEDQYNAFLINRGLSYFKDTILYANEMNMNHQMDRKLQFDYLLHSVKKAKRFSKWHKLEITPELEAIQAYFKCNLQRAREINKLLPKEQIAYIIKSKG